MKPVSLESHVYYEG